MKFRTELTPLPSPVRISLKTPVLAMGSCFATHLGDRLKQSKLPVLVNPFGTIYNPLSLFRNLQLALDNTKPDPQGYLHNQDIHYHYDFHSELSALSREELEKKISDRLETTHQFLHNTHFLILTFGTAFAYTLKESGQVVANCHKVPASAFRRDLLSQKLLLESFEELIRNLPRGIEVILTVSPVRHIRDTLELNAVSKSILRLFCHTASGQHDHVHYFPSYEIMLDDLRDYRFYTDDLLHPSVSAREYIWEKFSECWLDDPSRTFILEWDKLRRDLAHKPFHPGSASHRQFLMNIKKKLESIASSVDVSAEIEELNQRLNDQG